MSGIVIADYELIERAGGTETMALFKGKHILIPDRFRAVRMPQTGSETIKSAFRGERLKEIFEMYCVVAAQLAHALDSAEPNERTAVSRISSVISKLRAVSGRRVESHT